MPYSSFGTNAGRHIGQPYLKPSKLEPDRGHSQFSQNTNVYPAFGVVEKIQRNRQLMYSIFRMRAGVMLIGDRLQESLSDPLHRPYKNIRDHRQQQTHNKIHGNRQILGLQQPGSYQGVVNGVGIQQRQRNEASIAGRSRAYIRAAAPGQVTWKNSYWNMQRTRATRQTTIGPYVMGNMAKQSAMTRISNFMQGNG